MMNGGLENSVEEVAALLARKLSGRPSLVNVSYAEGISLEAEKGAMAKFERWEEGWVSLELADGVGRVGFASATLGRSLFDPDALIGAALASATVMPADPARAIEPRSCCYPKADLGIFDRGWDAADYAVGLDVVKRLEAAAFEAHPAIVSARKPTFEAESETRLVMICGEVAASWSETGFGVHVEVAAAGGGDRESGWAAAESRLLRALDPESVGREAATRAYSLLGARKAPTGVFPAIIERRVAAELLEVLAPAFLADSQRKKTALFPFVAGKAVFSPKLSLVDDGSLAGGPATQPVDDEGALSRANVCVEGGRLVTLLCDRAEGARLGVASTGNGSGGSERPCAPDVTNFFIPNGCSPAPGFFARLGRGVYITEVLGMHTADPITGDFSVGCAGFWVEGGEAAWPITQAAISGNLLELMAGIDEVGDDFRFTGSFGSPSLLVSAIRLAG